MAAPIAAHCSLANGDYAIVRLLLCGDSQLPDQLARKGAPKRLVACGYIGAVLIALPIANPGGSG